MALQNHPALYSGGNVKLDPTPYVNIALRARAQKAAQDEAIDKYYQKIPETINDKGVRDQEIEVLNDMKNDIFKFGVDNREALRKGDGAARLALDKKFRKAQTYAQESKNRTATAAKISLLRGNPKYDYIFRDKGFMEKVLGHDLPIDTEGSQAIDFNQLTLPPTPFEATKYFKGFADIKPDYKVSTKPNPDDKNTLIEVQTPVFNEQHKQAIYQRAASDLVDNPSFEEEMKKNLAADPNLIAKLYDTFKHNYGRDITDETKDIDLAAAYTLLGLGIAAEKQKTVPSIDARNKEWDRRNEIAFGQSMAKIAANKAAGKVDEVVDYLSDEVANDAGENTTVELGGKKREVIVVYTDKVDPQRLDIITGRDLSKKQVGVNPIPIKQVDGKVKMGYYVDPGTGDWEGDGGQKISRERVKDDYINKKAASKFKASAGTKGSENTKKPKVSKPKSDPLKLF